MIVNYQEEGWEIISQRAHGLLAGEVCFHWRKEDRPTRWLETVVATIEHDDAFNELEKDDVLLNDNGGPMNFKMRDFEQDKCEKLMNLALSKSRYIALLTARHIRFLHETSTDADAKAFCNRLKKLENIWLKETGLAKEEISQAYAILEWCDAFSLLVCRRMIQPEGRKSEVSSGPDNRMYEVSEPVANTLTVNPWPFDIDQFEIRFESKMVTQLQFGDTAEFRAILMQTPPRFHTYKVSKS